MTRSHGTSGLTLLGISAERLHRVAHRREIDHARHAGEVLQDHAPRREGDLGLADVRGVVGGQRLHVIFGHHSSVTVPEAALQQDLDRERESIDLAERGECIESVDGAITLVGREGGSGGKRIVRGHTGSDWAGHGAFKPSEHLRREFKDPF